MKSNPSDYIDKTYNELTILDTIFKNGQTYAKCKCSCGKITQKRLASIKCGHTKSCGCLSVKNLFTKNTKRTLVNDFSVLSPETTYWAGFLFGDGCIDKNNKLQICLGQGAHNVEHLKKLSTYLFNHDYVCVYKDKCHLQVTSDKVAYNLQKFGIIPNKTYHGCLKMPTKYQADFIRGYFDADGWFSRKESYNKTYNKYYVAHVWGLCSYRKDNLDIMSKHLPTKCKTHKIPNRHLYDLRIQNKLGINTVIDYLQPQNKYLCLSKKWEKIWTYQQN